jgi:methoxymalonate biosynthesis acyl carrier protein
MLSHSNRRGEAGATEFFNLEHDRMTPDEIRRKTNSFISSNFRNFDLKDDDDIFAMGLANSLFAMQLVMFVEKELQVKVHDDDLDIDNFRTVNAVTGLVTRKLAAVQAVG